MKTTMPPTARQRLGRACGRLLGATLSIWMLGGIYVPAVAATTPTVPVDQQPLTLQPPIPPDITLMLDDSGSMAWDYMPDACYLYGVTCHGTNNGINPINKQGVDTIDSINNDAIIDAANNGVYYNPTVTYLPPPTATGGSYPGYTNITSAPLDGFKLSSGNQDVTQYSDSDVTGENDYDNDTINYSMSNQQTVTGVFNQTVNETTDKYGYTYTADQVCEADFSNDGGTNSDGPTFTGISHDANDNWATGTCVFNYSNQVTFNYFQYSTGAASGPYTLHYVAPASQGCGTQANCVLDTDTSGVSAPSGVTVGTNVANWFAYYHTRILMAKSGLMSAFSKLNTKFRVGFGSINNHGLSAIQSLGVGNYKKFNSQYIAYVQPFGDGSSGTQKSNFWNWAASIQPNDGTPLRYALDAVGQYYKQSQPWSQMSSDPASVTAGTEVACRQAYTILTTDGFWNSNFSGIGNVDGTKGPTISPPNAGQSYTYTPVAPYMDSYSNTLADVAMKYWETDLRPSTANEVQKNDEDPAFWQHMVTFTMGLGFQPYGILPTGTTIQQIFSWSTGQGSAISGFSWPKPASNSLYNIADLAHAGVNGHGGFYSATSPQSFASGLSDALARTQEVLHSGASLAADSTELSSGSVAYQATYYAGKWYGDLSARSIDSSTGVISSTINWSASAQLVNSATVSGGTLAFPNRNIVTYVPPASSSGTGSFVAFKDVDSSTPPVLSSNELTALGSTAAAQATMVDYLRGDTTASQKNSGSLRNRTSSQGAFEPLGDVVDSQPVYVGVPNPDEFENQTFTGINAVAPSTDSFASWAVGTTSGGTAVASAASQREALIYVAANDGMLHGFDAATGVEKYAYLPGAVITAGLAQLADPNYGTDTVPHQYFNDGELTVADAYLPALAKINGSAWHTILVGTTGRGSAKAVYALDVTNPAAITPLWERSAGDGMTNSNYIGQMTGKPVIVQVADGNWQVLIGNGYNSAAGTAALLEFNLATGALSVHGTDTTAGNGLAAPVTWMDDPSNGISMEAYAGDLKGRVWEFPLDDATVTGSGSTATTSYSADLTAAGVKEFTATDPSGTAQPITGGMTAGRDPVTGNVWVFFGTGQYLSSGDLTNMQVQSWYGLIVQAGANQPSLPSLPTTTLSSNMVQRAITYEVDGNASATPPTLGERTVTTLPTPSDMLGKLGWYMNLEQPQLDASGNPTGSYNAQGERMVTPNQFQGNLLLATTRIPIVTDICYPSGSGWVMAVDPFTGTNPAADFFLVNGGNGSVTLPNGKVLPAAGVGFSALPNNPIFVGSDMLNSFDTGGFGNVSTSGAAGAVQRVSWQELVNP